MKITKDLIVGSKITDVFTYHSEYDGYPTCEAFFTNDKGITFSLPNAGYEWETTEVHPQAEKLEDTTTYNSFKRVKKWFFFSTWVEEEPQINDDIKKIKSLKIDAVLNPKMDEELKFYPPSEVILKFEDQSFLSLLPLAPEGIGAGLGYHEKIEDEEDYVDFFDIPVGINE